MAFGRKKPITVLEEPGPDAMSLVDPSADGASSGEAAGVAASEGRKRRGRRKDSVIPPVGTLTKIRRVHDKCIEDYGGFRYAVWEVFGGDVLDNVSVNGWAAILNGIEFPVQVLIRQHTPDYSVARDRLREARPEHMREGWVNSVCDSLLGYLKDVEDRTLALSRRWYIVCRNEKAVELGSALSQSGFDVDRLDDIRLGLLLQACVSGMGFGHTQDVYQIKEDVNSLQLNHRYGAVYEVNRWPRSISPIFLERLLRTGEELDVSLWIDPLSQRESNSRLLMQRSRFEGSRIVSQQKGRLVPAEVELAISDIVRISDGVERGVCRLYRRSMTIAVYGRSVPGLRGAREKVEGHFRSALAGVLNMRFRQGQAFSRMMPACRPGMAEADLTDTDTLLRLFPFGPRDLDTQEGTLLGKDLRSQTSIFLDGFSPAAMNGHMVVMARSGAGKSFFTKLRTLRESSRGIPIYIIDPEGEYGSIARALGGRVFVPGSKGYGLNPFVFRYAPDSDFEGDLTRRVASLGALVGVMLEGNLDQELKATIDHCLTRFYDREYRESRGEPVLGKGGMKSFHDFLKSDELAGSGGPELAQLLSPFATGSSRFLMQESDNDLLADEAPVTSFNLKNLSNRLKPVATSVCAEVVWGLAVTDPRPRILIVDECWTVLSTPSGAEALLTIVKRARKYRLGLMAVTQDVQDFLSENHGIGAIAGHAGRSLLQNSALKLALQQDQAALPQVVDALGLNGDMADFLEKSLRGQGLLVGEHGDCYPMGIFATPEESELIENRDWLRDGDAASEAVEMEPAALETFAPGAEEVPEGALSARLSRLLAQERSADDAEPAAV